MNNKTPEVIKKLEVIQDVDLKDLTKTKLKAFKPEQAGEFRNALDEASYSNRPFLQQEKKPDGSTQLSVNGDANRTEIEKKDYTIVFWIPYDEIQELFGGIPEGAIEVPTNGMYILKKEFKQKFITPRASTSVIEYVGEVLPYLMKLKENKEIASMSEMEAIRFANDTGNDLLNAMYKMVFAFLGIDEKLMDYATSTSIFISALTMTVQHPEIFNEVDFL